MSRENYSWGSLGQVPFQESGPLIKILDPRLQGIQPFCQQGCSGSESSRKMKANVALSNSSRPSNFRLCAIYQAEAEQCFSDLFLQQPPGCLSQQLLLLAQLHCGIIYPRACNVFMSNHAVHGKIPRLSGNHQIGTFSSCPRTLCFFFGGGEFVMSASANSKNTCSLPTLQHCFLFLLDRNEMQTQAAEMHFRRRSSPQT